MLNELQQHEIFQNLIFKEHVMAVKYNTEEHALPSLSLVFGYIAVKELQRLDDRIAVLDRLGYGNAEIAKICNTSIASVRTIKSTVKKSKNSRRQK
ncbi:hypothetical protein HUU40_31245 [candidate division KSB1 bacterium]|nr:hypothetical protein [candidate division KSB1 bacterium]